MIEMCIINIHKIYSYLACDGNNCSSLIQFLASLGQIVFGASALWIAFLQWKLGRNNSKFQVYEKRFEAYKELKNYLGAILRNAKVETQDLVSFRWKFEEHYFLFGDDIHKYIKDIYSKSLEFRKYDNKLWGMNAVPVGDERSRLVDEQDKILDWLINQNEESKKYFEKYLRIK